MSRDAVGALPVLKEPEGRALRLWRIVLSLSQTPDPPRRPAAGGASGVAGLAENLVFEFDEAYTAFVEGFVALPSERQMLALQAVDTQLARMVAARDATLWTEQARREAPVWNEVRTLAAQVLAAFDWPMKPDRSAGRTDPQSGA